MKGLVLAIFPGIDLLGRAFEEAGWCVVRGPDVLWGGDIRHFSPPPGVFDGIVGGDPCQSHSALARLVRHNGNEPKFPDMSPEFRRVIGEARPRWYVRENVPGAPLIAPDGYDCWQTLLVDAHVGGMQPRMRRISLGLRAGLWPEPLRSPLTLIEYGEEEKRRRHSVMADARRVPVKIGGSGKVKRSVVAGHGNTPSQRDAGMGGVLPIEDACEAMGVDRDFFKHSPFTKHGQRSVLGNAVTMPMGRAIAAMVERVMEALNSPPERGIG